MIAWRCPECGMLTTQPLIGSHDQIPYCGADNTDLDEVLVLSLAAQLETIRTLSVDECPECDGGRTVRYCSAHGLNGVAPR